MRGSDANGDTGRNARASLVGIHPSVVVAVIQIRRVAPHPTVCDSRSVAYYNQYSCGPAG